MADRKAEFERLGPDAIRARIASGQVHGGNWTEDALTWLSDHERSERSRIEASNAENMRIARTAKTAAVVAAIAASITIPLAIIGIILSILAWRYPLK